MLTSVLWFHSCSSNPQSIVNKAMETHGSEWVGESEITFRFRNRHYKAYRQKGRFSLRRMWKDSLGYTEDILSNQGFTRYRNGQRLQISDSLAQVYGNSVNSVHYFAVLPYGLNDTSVRKTFLSMVEINGQSYFKIKISFSEEGGGTDFEDVFMYWMHTQKFTVDFLAYSFHVNGGGLRFREAFNRREIEGILFQDYRNFKPTSPNARLEDLDKLFEQGQLELLSEIRLEDVEVTLWREQEKGFIQGSEYVPGSEFP